MAKQESKYYGLQTCVALWKKRPQDVIRVYLEEGLVPKLKPLLKWCAEHKKVYRIVPREELEKVSGSVHHEGLSIVAKEPAEVSEEVFLKGLPSGLLYLDGVENPHNLGSIVRTAAHFNFPLIVGEEGKLPPLSPSAYRVAKGGAEFVRVVRLKSPKKTLNALKKQGYAFIGTSSHKGTPLYSFTFPEKSVICMGSESLGLSSALEGLATHHIQIPGTGDVESLNVSVAAALLLSEYFRQVKR